MAQSCHRLGRLEGQKGLDPVIRCTCDRRQQSGQSEPSLRLRQWPLLENLPVNNDH